MVDRNNLQQVNMLHGELNSLDAAEQALDKGGVIISMEISPGPLPEETPDAPRMAPFGFRVNTSGITYPKAMVDSIKQQFTARRHQIEGELKSLGLTGVESR